MGAAFFGGASAFIVNLGGGEVAMAEGSVNHTNVDAGIEK
jgi:hypothetical protein